MKGSPLVSVVIPTYNRVDELARAINSVKNQTFKDWEIIIIDDCSTDNTKIIGQNTQFNNPSKFKYFCLGENSGSPVAPRNYGVKQASGKYIAFLDSDDYWHPNKLRNQIMRMQSINASMSYHNLFISGKDNRYSSKKWSQMSLCFSGSIFNQLLKKNFIPTSSVMIKKDIYLKYGMMDLKYTISHDWDLWLKIARENYMLYIPETLGWLTMHSGSVITECHQRRVESRAVVRSWKAIIDPFRYRKIMLYYYLAEVMDLLPAWFQRYLRNYLNK